MSNVIKAAKRLNCDTQIINLKNTAWEIVNLEMDTNANNDNVHSLNVGGRMISNQQNTFKNNFLSVAGKVNVNNTHSNVNKSSMECISQIFMTPYPNIKHKPISTKETGQIIKYFK